MPFHRTIHHRRRLHGGALRHRIGDWMKKALGFTKSHHLVSLGAKYLAPHAGKYSDLVSKVGTVAGHLGYGRHRHHGRGLRLAGAGIGYRNY